MEPAELEAKKWRGNLPAVIRISEERNEFCAIRESGLKEGAGKREA